jgi:SAM-dependent methyltransferase
VLRSAFKGNYAAPLSDPRSILDVGTGSGRWAMDLAQQYPQAQVIGLDVNEPKLDERSESFQSLDKRPHNYRFALGNVLEGLNFPSESFDFVHQRLLFFAIPSARWPLVLQDLCRVTAPGGWVEVAEGHFGYTPEGPATQRLVEVSLDALLKRGIDPRVGPMLGEQLIQAGLVNVQTRVVDLPVGAWGGRVGSLLATDLAAAHTSAKPLALSMGMSDETWTSLFNGMRQEWEQQQSSWPFYIAYGQRA